MTELDFLSGDNAQAQTETQTEVPNTDVQTESTQPASEPQVASKYPNVLGTYSNIEEAESALGQKLYTVSDFAAALTVKNITEKNMGADGVVPANNVYTATKAVRHPLPVVLVGDTALLPEAAFQAWDERPSRGEGGAGTGGKLTDDELLVAAGRAHYNRERRVDFVKKAQDKLEIAEKLLAKRSAQLSARNLNWDAAHAAFTEAQSKGDAGKEISDSE